MNGTAQINVRPLNSNPVCPQNTNQNICSQNETSKSVNNDYYSWGIYVIVFLIVAIITWIIIYAIRPNWYRVEVNGVLTDQLNGAKILLTSIIVAIIIVLLVWLFRSRY